MYNKIVMIGNLTKESALTYLPSGTAVYKNSIATSHKYKAQSGEQKEEVCFLEFNIIGKMAETANQYLNKGSKVLLEGRLKQENWTTNDGQNRSKHTLLVETMKMLDGKKNGESTQQKPQSTKPQQVQQNYVPEYDVSDDEIPFS